MDELEALKGRLRGYRASQIRFNEPHFTQQLQLRGGDRQQVIDNILNPERLVRRKRR